MIVYAHTVVEHNDALQCRTQWQNPISLVVLVLFAYEEQPYLSIGYDKLHLLLRTRRIERNSYCTYSKCAEVGEQTVYCVLRKDSDIFLHLDAEIQQCVRHFLDIL